MEKSGGCCSSCGDDGLHDADGVCCHRHGNLVGDGAAKGINVLNGAFHR